MTGEELYLRLHHVLVYVKDLDRSLRFWVERLGFNLVVDYSAGPDLRFILVAPPDGSALVGLTSPKPEWPDYGLIGKSGQTVFVTEDVAAKYEAWLARGVRFLHPPKTEPWGGTVTRFEDDDGNLFLLAAWDDMTRGIEAQRRAAAEKRREIEIAKEVQARLFPQAAPPLKTLRYAGVCIQAREVGGDYYDFLELGRERLGLVIGDISGKGIAAALLMANLQANLRSRVAMASEEPERFLHSVNELFYRNTAERDYATLLFAEYDDETRRLRFANCGHVPGILLRTDGSLERLSSTGTVLGLFSRWDCLFAERELAAGDTVVFHTDGVTEAFNAAREEFGEERLVAALRENRGLGVEELLGTVVQAVKEFSVPEPSDDVTLIVARCVG